MECLLRVGDAGVKVTRLVLWNCRWVSDRQPDSSHVASVWIHGARGPKEARGRVEWEELRKRFCSFSPHSSCWNVGQNSCCLAHTLQHNYQLFLLSTNQTLQTYFLPLRYRKVQQAEECFISFIPLKRRKRCSEKRDQRVYASASASVHPYPGLLWLNNYSAKLLFDHGAD